MIVAWHKICKPLDEGGLGLRSLRSVNEAAALRLCWDFVKSNKHWDCLLRARTIINSSIINYHIGSSIL